MTQKEIIKDKKVLASLEAEYKHVRCLVDSVRTTITDLNFEDMVPDQQERYLMMDQLNVYEQVQQNLLNRIRFYRNRIKANEPEPWEKDESVRTVNTPCGPVRLVNHDEVSKEELCEIAHHCGQDAKEEAHVSLNELLGMKVICVGGSAMKCEGCSWDCGNCVKVELVGGDYLCLAEPQKEESIIGLDDSPKSFEETYRDSMNLLREFCIKQSEANRRLVEALRSDREETPKTVTRLDGDE